MRQRAAAVCARHIHGVDGNIAAEPAAISKGGGAAVLRHHHVAAMLGSPLQTCPPSRAGLADPASGRHGTRTKRQQPALILLLATAVLAAGIGTASASKGDRCERFTLSSNICRLCCYACSPVS